MPDASTILGIFDKTLSVLGLIREGKRKRNEETDRALFALYTALCETRSYVSDLRRRKKRSHKREHSIALLWHNAAVPLRQIDRDLAARCSLKGSYWLEPETWNDALIEKNRIGLDTVFQEARELLLR